MLEGVTSHGAGGQPRTVLEGVTSYGAGGQPRTVLEGVNLALWKPTSGATVTW